METNFFKANINEAELNKLENELDEQERERFTKILNNENFSLLDNEIKNPRAWDCDSDEIFFCDIVRNYENRLFNDKNRLFNDKKAYKMTASFSYKYCMRLYEYDESECMQRSIFDAKKSVWKEYVRFLKELARWRYHPSRIKTQEQKELFSQITEICDEYCFDDGEFKNNLNYDKTAFSYGEVGVINDERVNLIELIEKSAHLLSEIEKTLTSISVDELLSEIDKTDRSLNIHELLELAKSLLKRNSKHKIFTNNNINFKYLYDNDIFLRFCF